MFVLRTFSVMSLVLDSAQHTNWAKVKKKQLEFLDNKTLVHTDAILTQTELYAFLLLCLAHTSNFLGKCVRATETPESNHLFKCV